MSTYQRASCAETAALVRDRALAKGLKVQVDLAELPADDRPAAREVAERWLARRRAAREQSGASAAEKPDQRKERVWQLVDGRPSPIEITTGISDGRMTQVTEAGVKADTPLIIKRLPVVK